MGIEHEIQPTADERSALVVADGDASAAEAALAAWEAENPSHPTLPARMDYGRSLAGVVAGLAILAVAALVDLRGTGHPSRAGAPTPRACCRASGGALRPR